VVLGGEEGLLMDIPCRTIYREGPRPDLDKRSPLSCEDRLIQQPTLSQPARGTHYTMP
jgi:hypothetical protein